MKLLNKFSFATKIYLMCAIFFIPIISLLVLNVLAYKKDIDFGEAELKGNYFIKPLISVLGQLAERNGFEQDHTQRKSEIETNSKQISQNLAAFEANAKNLGNDLQFTAEGLAARKREKATLAAVMDQWKDLEKTTPVFSNAEYVEKYQKLTATIRTIVTHIGDTSNLILDPDLDTYYLMDFTLVVAPQTIERMLNLEKDLAQLSQKSSLKMEDKVTLASTVALLNEADFMRVVGDIETALNEDKNFSGNHAQFQSEMPSLLTSYKKDLTNLITSLTAVQKLESITDGGKSIYSEISKAQKNTLEIWAKSIDFQSEMITERISVYKAKQRNAIILSALSITLLLTIALGFARSISKQLTQVVEKLTEESKAMTEIAAIVEKTAHDLSNSATESAAAIEETASSMEEIASMLVQSSQNANKGQDITNQCSDEANTGREIVHRMNSAMDEIKVSNDKLFTLSNIFNEIQNRTRIINDIVFETRLLSFNASIESARAGVHGKGFAVVAEEVGKLASMSGKAADEIRSMLENSAKEVQSIVSGTHERVEIGIQVSKECAENFITIGETIEKIQNSIQLVASATKEQESGVKQTNQAMIEMEKVSQMNSGHADALANESSRLGLSVKSIKDSVDDIRIVILGDQKAS